MKNRFFWAALGLLAVLAAGCTEMERNGYSSIPQNSPASWDVQPYGQMK